MSLENYNEKFAPDNVISVAKAIDALSRVAFKLREAFNAAGVDVQYSYMPPEDISQPHQFHIIDNYKIENRLYQFMGINLFNRFAEPNKYNKKFHTFSILQESKDGLLNLKTDWDYL